MKVLNLFFLGLLLLTAFSCYEKEEGCLDAEAVNFDVTADDDCCCQYPKLVLRMSHVYGEDALSFGADLTNDLNSPFEILSVQYYLSGFNLIDESNNSFSTTSTISLPQLSGDDVVTTNDIKLITRSVFVDTIGFFPTYGTYEKLEFEIGVKDAAQNTDPEKVDESYPLATQTDPMWDEDNLYVATKILLKPDTTSTSSDTLTINIFENTLVTLDSQLELSRATHINLNLKADYSIWFNGIDFQNDDEQAIIDKIKINLASSLSFL